MLKDVWRGMMIFFSGLGGWLAGEVRRRHVSFVALLLFKAIDDDRAAGKNNDNGPSLSGREEMMVSIRTDYKIISCDS